MREVCADDLSVLALSVVRFVAAGYMTGDVACWEAAYNVAESALGTPDGQRMVAAMTGVMRAIRAERSNEWSFMPASCCRITPDEEELVRLLALARAGERKEVVEAARHVAGGPAPRLAQCAALAADLLAVKAGYRFGDIGDRAPAATVSPVVSTRLQ